MPTTTNNKNKLKAKIFRALSDPIRMEIVSYLRDGEKCVCEIVPHLGLIQPLVSRHLKMLKDTGIVRCRKDGTKRMYSIVDNEIYYVIDALTPELMNVLSKKAIENITCG
jgi:DNA-binding transcriptional ArsR family regulator